MTSASSANRLVYGFWPYWIPTDSYQPDWSCLDYVCYFSLDANSDGTLNADNIGAEYYIVRDTAHSLNVKVPLALTCFDQDIQDEILAYHKDDLAGNLARKLADLGADGVCIDFEDVRDTNSLTHDSNTSLMQVFMTALHDRLDSLNKNYHVSFCVLGNVEKVYRNSMLSKYTDAVVLMGYEYHWSTAPVTGAISPYNDADQLDVEDSVDILEKYYPRDKIILGLPFYGYDWPCASAEPGARTEGEGAIVYMNSAIANAGIYGRLWDSKSHTPWYKYQSKDTWHQCWYDDEESLGLKFDYIISEKLAGPGFWALGYEGSDASVWNLIKRKFNWH
ncbi:MAG: glycosyl hydrolase family 18 protein [Dehalococcoidia bacterium]